MKAKTAVRYSAKRSISRNRNDPASARIGPHTSRLPIRVLTAVPICDGHDSAINTLNLEFIRHGIEVVYLGYHRSAKDIVRAAVQEDVRAIGISSYNGGHIEFFSGVVALLRRSRTTFQVAKVPASLRLAGTGHIGLFGGGGGTITPTDAKVMKRRGVDELFFAGTPLDDMVQWVQRKYAGGANAKVLAKILPLPFRFPSPNRTVRWVRGEGNGRGEFGDLGLAKLLTAAEHSLRRSLPTTKNSKSKTKNRSE